MVEIVKEKWHETEWVFQVVASMLAILFFMVIPFGIIVGMFYLSLWIEFSIIFEIIVGIFTVVVLIMYYIGLGVIISE